MVGCSSSDDAKATDTSSGLPSAQAWKLGVMADTQWVATSAGDNGMNPHSCAVEIARQIQQAFIGEGVKFVVQVGDLCDKGKHNPSSSSTAFTVKYKDGQVRVRRLERVLPARHLGLGQQHEHGLGRA